MQKTIYIFTLVFLLASVCNSQNYKDFIKKGDEVFADGDYYRAALLYKNALDKSNTPEGYYKYADACRLSNDYVNAEKMFSKLVRDSVKQYPLAQFRLAEMQKHLEQYQLAQINFREYYEKNKSKDEYFTRKANQEIISCEKAIDMRFSPIGVDISHLDTAINTLYSDFGAFSLEDTLLLYSSMQPEGDSIFRVNIYHSGKENKQWHKSSRLDSIINTPSAHIANPVFCKKNQRLYFTSTSFDASSLTCIYSSKYDNGIWGTPEKLPETINQPGISATQPAVATLGDRMYLLFVSERENGMGQLDIWYSEIIDDNTFGKVMNIGVNTKDIDQDLAYFFETTSAVNTEGNEITPFFDEKDSTLYFSSDWHYGMGGYDIFSIKGDFSSWQEAINYGYPINTCSNDLYFKLDTKRKYAYLSSNRKGSLSEKNEGCCNDIFIWQLPDYQDVEEIEKTKVKIFEKEIKLLVPLTLYFHNDEPNPRTTDTVTDANFENTLYAYLNMKDEYKKEFSRGLKKKEIEIAQERIDNFFTYEVEANFKKLQDFAKLSEELLMKGQTIVITLKGHCSPLHNTDYNKKLAKRRTSSLMNYFRAYNNGVFLEYEAKGQLILEEVAVGEDLANINVSDNINDLRNSVYSPDAGLERRIQIIAVSVEEK